MSSLDHHDRTYLERVRVVSECLRKGFYAAEKALATDNEYPCTDYRELRVYTTCETLHSQFKELYDRGMGLPIRRHIIDIDTGFVFLLELIEYAGGSLTSQSSSLIKKSLGTVSCQNADLDEHARSMIDRNEYMRWGAQSK